MSKQTTNYRLYVWVRDDLASMSRGKACAQVAHAVSQCAIRFTRLPFGNDLFEQYLMWNNSASAEKNPLTNACTRDFEDFGTTIVLSADSGDHLIDIINQLTSIGPEELLCGLVVDPSYPIADGSAIVTAQVTTVCWAFVNYKKFDHIIKQFKLY